MSVPAIDAAIDRLEEGLRAAGLPRLQSPTEVAAIDAIATAVTPYVLPADLRRFWMRVDPEAVALHTFPMLRGPAYALELMGGLREDGVGVPIAPPPLFLPLDYAGGCYAVIELGTASGDGGTLFEWEFDAVAIVAHGLADRLSLLADLLSEGTFERGADVLTVDHRAEQMRRAARLDTCAPHPVYGNLHTIPNELESWPAHWLAASGVDLRDREPLGATHTVAELVAAASVGSARGRIHGRVSRLLGSSDGALVVVDDGTGALDVWCPRDTSVWGPANGRRFEFALALGLGLQDSPASAVASDIRPLD